MSNAVEYFYQKLTRDFERARYVAADYFPKQIEYTNTKAKYWVNMPRLVIGVADWRSRLGKFSNPWNSHSATEFAPPPFAFTPDTFDDIADTRALEIFDEARRTNRKILVLWSGGIDSTMVLSSFIKTLEPVDREILTVCCNITSMFENSQFYVNHISNQLECMHYNKFDLTPNLLKDYIVVHGDPGDCLQGPSVPAYAKFLKAGMHKESWKNHIPALIESVQPHTSHPHYVEGFGKWFVDNVSSNLEEVGPENVTSVADWWWWTYYNFKWEFSCQRPFFFSRKDNTTSFSLDEIADFAKNTYFNTADWQMWSYTNLDKLIGQNRSSHKKFARDYIHELDKNELYYETKVKTAGAPANIQDRLNVDLPVYYDENWKGHYYTETAVDEVSKHLLERY